QRMFYVSALASRPGRDQTMPHLLRDVSLAAELIHCYLGSTLPLESHLGPAAARQHRLGQALLTSLTRPLSPCVESSSRGRLLVDLRICATPPPSLYAHLHLVEVHESRKAHSELIQT